MSVTRGSSPTQSARDQLIDAQRRWLENERRRHELSDERLRAVWAAVDSGMSHGEVAKAMSEAGKTVPQFYVSKLLANGYPEPRGDEAA